MADAPSHQRGLGTTPTPANPRTRTLKQELSLSLYLHTVVLYKRSAFQDQGLRARSPRRSTPFVAQGSALRSAPSFAPPLFEAFRERSRKGAFLLPGRVTPRIHQSGRAAPPLPLLTKRDGHQEGDSGGRNSGGRFRREKFGREMSFQAPRRSLCCSYPASFTRPAVIVAAR